MNADQPDLAKARPFAGTAAYYARYRPAITAEVADYLATAAGSRPNNRLLDIGTGTGQIIEALSSRFDDLIGVDPEMEMLEVAGERLRKLVYEKKLIRLFCSTIEEFTPPPGWRPHLTVFSRSFHWIDQDETLLKLSRISAPGAVVALMSDHSFQASTTGWQQAAVELSKRFLGEPAFLWTAKNPMYKRQYSDILLASPFSIVEKATFPVTRVWNCESILGYLYSTSTAGRFRFGDRIQQFESAMQSELKRFSSTDQFIEYDEWDVIIGRLQPE